jgi:hypothetical protein
MLKATGSTNRPVFEAVRYSSHGVPIGASPGDVDGDRDEDTPDNENRPGSYTVWCHCDLDSDLDITDQNFTIANTGRVLGRCLLWHSSASNRKGYCGCEHDGVNDTLAHFQNRRLRTELGRWSRRNPTEALGNYTACWTKRARSAQVRQRGASRFGMMRVWSRRSGMHVAIHHTAHELAALTKSETDARGARRIFALIEAKTGEDANQVAAPCRTSAKH